MSPFVSSTPLRDILKDRLLTVEAAFRICTVCSQRRLATRAIFMAGSEAGQEPRFKDSLKYTFEGFKVIKSNS
jgi:hypothetical protein